MRSYLVTGFGILELMRPSLAIQVLTFACGEYFLLWLFARLASPRHLTDFNPENLDSLARPHT